MVLCNANSAAWTVTLPAAPIKGDMVGVKKTDSSGNYVTVQGSAGGTPTIDGDPNLTLTVQDAAATLVYDGAAWQISSTAVLYSASSGSSSGGQADTLLFPAFTSQYWYDRRAGSVLPTVALATVSWTASKTFYFACFLPKALTIDTFGLSTGSSGQASQMRIGTYTCTAAGAPGTLIADYGTVATPAAATTPYTMAAAVTLPKGWFYFALAASNVSPGSTLGINNSNYISLPQPGIANSGGFTYSTLVASAAIHWQETNASTGGTAAALPASATPTAVYGTNSTPNIWFKVA
jgi:hypothetical protein